MAKAKTTKIKIDGRRLDRYELVHKTLMDIVSSPRVKQFCIGISGNPARRRYAYARWCRQYDAELIGFVLLGWDLSPDEVVSLEGWLSERAHKHKKYINCENVKYFPNVHRRSQRQGIYVAWWHPRFAI